VNDMSRELLVIRSWRGCTDADKRERSVAYGGESEIAAGQTGCRFASFFHSRVRCPHPGVYPTEILNSAHPIYMGGVAWSYLAPGPPAPRRHLRASEMRSRELGALRHDSYRTELVHYPAWGYLETAVPSPLDVRPSCLRPLSIWRIGSIPSSIMTSMEKIKVER